MTEYGGFGGVQGEGLETPENVFEAMVERTLGNDMRSDDSLCRDVWASLANIEWRNASGDTAGYSWRAAGDLIAAILGRGDYMDWYSSGDAGTVPERIRVTFGAEGWTPHDY